MARAAGEVPFYVESVVQSGLGVGDGRETEREPSETLDAALGLLEQGNPEAADRLLTAMTLERPGDPLVWLAAAISRVLRGKLRSAVSALRMSAWIDGNALANDLLFRFERMNG
jgi:hypothetical protein